MAEPQLAKNVRRIEQDEPFHFACHPGVDCFTDCCRQLELALTPYDVLRLRKGTGLSAGQLHDEYIIMEKEPGEPFPRFYLTMVDDGQASCVFVTLKGCSVYHDRPGACRAYPMGRAAIRQDNGFMDDFHVLLKEKHCQGFAEQQKQTVATYSEEQGLIPYNHFNDAVAAILQHDLIRKGMVLSDEQIHYFTLALYDLDHFREQLFAGRLPGSQPDDDKKDKLENDEKLLLFSIKWLEDFLFGTLDIDGNKTG